MIFQKINRAIADPRGIVERDRQRGVEGLHRARARRQLHLVEALQLLAAAVLVEPAFVVLAARRLHRRPVVVALDHQLDVLEAHIRAAPVRVLVAVAALGRAGGLEGVRGGEVRLADVAGAVAGARESGGETRAADFRIEVDAVVGDAVRVRQQAGQDRSARGLAHQVGRDARRESRAGARHGVEVRRLDLAALEAVAVAALLVRGDEDNVRLTWHSYWGSMPAALTIAGQRATSARMNSP